MNANKWPRLMYHKHKAPGGWRVASPAERAALGKGWSDTPFAPAPEPVPVAAEVPAAAAPSLDDKPIDEKPLGELHAIAKDLGLKVHHKAGRDKVLAAIKEHGGKAA